MSRRSHPAGAPEVRSASDAELILRSRAGEQPAFAELYERHVAAARSAARSYARSRSDADDLVSEAFAKVLNALSNEGGPEVAFRQYLLTCVRNAAFDRTRRDRKIRFTDEVPESAPAGLPGDPAVDGLERRLTAQAFAGLPERWRMVLWHTEVEGMTPAEIAPLLGIAPNAVAALSYRAREGLREAYLQAHVREESDSECRWTASRLGAFVRDRLPRRERPRVEAHLDGCLRCRAALDELTAVNSSLRAVIGPIVLGAASTRYLAGLGVGGAKAGLSSVGWVQTIVAAPAKAALVGTAATVAAASVTVTTVALATGGGGRAVPSAAAGSRPPVTVPAPGRGPSGEPPAGPVVSTSTTTAPTPTSTSTPANEDAEPEPDPDPAEEAVVDPVIDPGPGPTTTTIPVTTTTAATTTSLPTTTTTPVASTSTSTTSTSTSTTSTTTVPPVGWQFVSGGSGISVSGDGHTVDFSGSGERRLLAHGAALEPFRVTLDGTLGRPAGYPDRLPGRSLGYGVFVRAAVTDGGIVTGYTFQVDPGVGGFKLACWDARGEEHTLVVVAAPAADLFGRHAVDVSSEADGRVTFRSDGVDVFGGPVDLADLSRESCEVAPGERVGLRAWSDTTATIERFSVSVAGGGATSAAKASGAGSWSPLLLGAGPLAGLAVERSRRPRRSRGSRRSRSSGRRG